MLRNISWVRVFVVSLSLASLTTIADTARAAAAITYDDIWAEYNAGRISDAISRLEKSLPSPRNITQLQDRLGDVALIVDICTRAADWDCVVTWSVPALTLTLNNPKADSELLRKIAQRQAGYYFALLSAIQETPEAARQGLVQGLERDPDEPFDSERYIDRQLLAAQLQLYLDDRVSARVSVERALATLLSVLNVREYRWFFATRLVTCISMLTSLGDVERAFRHYLVSGNFLAQSFPATSIDYVTFRLAESNLLQQAGNLPAALNAAKQARAAMNNINVSERSAYFWNFQIDLELALVSLLAGDVAEADIALLRLENSIGTGKLATSSEPLGSGELSVLAMRALHRLATGAPPDMRAENRLRQPLDPTLSAAATRQFEIYRNFGLLASSFDQKTNDYATARDIAREYLSFVTDRARFSFEIFPRPSSLDRLISGVLVRAIAAASAPDAGDAGLLLQLADISTRSPRSFDSEALAILGLAADQEERQLLHQGLRLASRRNRHEQEELRRLIHAAGVQEPTQNYLVFEYGRRIVLADFFERIERTRAHFSAANPAVNTRSLVPRIGDLQSSLRQDEAVLKVLPIAQDQLLSLCITSSDAEVRRSTADIATADNDARILKLALTASHGPDETLDAQYPAESAHRLYKTLFGPTEDCTSQKRLIFWLMSQTMMPVPVSALLKSVPTRTDVGYDLSAADWLVKSAAISMLETPDSLVAIRRGKRFGSKATMRLLGIGDPLLAGLTTDGQNRSTAVLRGSVRNAQGDIAALSPLPDSRKELLSAATAIGSPATLLVGQDATEAGLRRQPLSQYRYLAFATHGLIREEIPGLREAALVLTPVSTEDTFNDGLLTASELADLPLSADFVALSACNTANFDLAEFSADVPGLATALAIAGVPATLATLWPVESMTSGRVVAEVFAQLSTSPDMHPALALAQAQRSFLRALPAKSYAHPRFWAPFIVMGDSNYGAVVNVESASPPIAVSAVRLETQNGGEILAAGTDVKGGVYASAIGEWNGQSFARSAIRMSPNGDRVWKKDRYDFGAGRIVIPIGERAIFAAYSKPSEVSHEVRALLQVTDKNGDVISQATVVQPGLQIFPSGASVLPDGTFLAAFTATSAPPANPDADNSNRAFVRKVIIKRYSSALTPLDEIDVPFPSGATLVAEGILSAHGKLFIAAVDPTYYRKVTEYSDSLQNPRNCSLRPQTWLRVIDTASLTTSSAQWISDSFVSGFFATKDGSVFAVGHESLCEGDTRLVLWKVVNDGLEVIFRYNSLLSTQGRHGLELADGTILLAGYSNRVTNIRRLEERQVDADMYSDFNPRVSFSEKETKDLLIVALSPDGNEIDRVTIPFGGDVYVNGLLRTGWGVSAYGSVSGQGAFIDLAVTGPLH